MSCATLTPLSCSPNFPRAQYLDIRTLMHELIVNLSGNVLVSEIILKYANQNLIFFAHPTKTSTASACDHPHDHPFENLLEPFSCSGVPFEIN